MAGNFNVSSGDEDDDEDDDGYIHDHPFFGSFRTIPPGVLTMEAFLMDDLYTGISSKKRWQRIPEHESLRFVLNSEIYFLINTLGIPYLRELLLNSDHCKCEMLFQRDVRRTKYGRDLIVPRFNEFFFHCNPQLTSCGLQCASSLNKVIVWTTSAVDGVLTGNTCYYRYYSR